METSSKKWLWIVLGVVMVVLIAAFVWYLFFSTPGQRPTLGGLFPTGPAATTTSSGTGTQSPPVNDIYSGSNGRQPLLYELHKAPVAGLVVFDRGTTTTPIIRYIERGLGHVYETDLSTLTESQVSLDTVPGIQDAVWSSDGTAVAARRGSGADLSSIETYALKLPATASSTQAGSTGTFFPQDIVDIAAQGKNAFYLVKINNGVVGNLSAFDGSGRKQIFSSPFTEWQVSWPSKNTLLLTTKPSNGIPGHVYTLDASSGAFTRILANIPGITAIANNDASKILYLRGDGPSKGYTMHLYDIKSGTDAPFNYFTMPEKCTWSQTSTSTIYCAIPDSVPPGTYPDDWYQGVVSFSDSLWKINTSTGESTRILGLIEQDGTTMDATHLMLDSKDNTLSFINKNNGSLWRVLLNQSAFGNYVPVTNDVTQPES